MSLIIIILIGALIGWSAAIIARSDRAHRTAANIGAGIVGAVVVGALGSHLSLLEGVTATTVITAMLGAVALLLVLHLVWYSQGEASHRKR